MQMANHNAHLTIQDIARAAGVSTGTVSRVLNNRAEVKQQTRQKVLAVIKKLNYQPDQSARTLSFRQGNRIGLHIHGLRRLTPFYMLFLEYLVEALSQDGYRLQEIPSDKDGLPQYLTDGMILFGAYDADPRVKHLQANAIPFVLVGHQDGVRWVSPDDFDGGYQATQYLLELGHKDIVNVAGALTGQGDIERYSGYKQALLDAGLEVRRDYVVDGKFTTLGGYRAVRKAHEQGLRFSAIFAASDEMAVGALAALEDVGLKVPLEVSVIGFDDLPEVGEQLSTIRQHIDKVAASAVTLLKEALAGDPVRHELVPVELVIRSTTARKR